MTTLRKFSALWDKNLSTQNLDTLPRPPLIQTFSIPEVIATVKDSPTENFGTVRQKFFDGKFDTPPPLIQTFSIPENIAIVKDFPTEIFGTVRQKTFDGKSWYSPPPPSYPNFFDTRSYCNSKGFPYGNFRHCETKNFWRKILIFLSPPPPPHSYPNFLDTRNYCNSKGFP